MNEERFRAVKSDALTKDRWDVRFVIMDTLTGEIVDDAQGYGYKSAQKAHAAWNYKTKDKSRRRTEEKTKARVKKWCEMHADFMTNLEDTAVCIAKGSYGSTTKFNTKTIEEALKQAGYIDLPFTAYDLLRYGVGK